MKGERKLAICILCGGLGNRIWPLSFNGVEKQFIKIKNHSTFQEAILQANQITAKENIFLIINIKNINIAKEQMKEIDVICNLLIEEENNNTFDSLIFATLYGQTKGYEYLLTLHADQHYNENLKLPNYKISKDKLILFGYEATQLEPTMGNIIVEQTETNVEDIIPVKQFIEKPKALRIINKNEKCFVNSGMILCEIKILLKQLLFSDTKRINNIKKHIQDNVLKKSNNTPLAMEYPLFQNNIALKNIYIKKIKKITTDIGNWETISKINFNEKYHTNVHQINSNCFVYNNNPQQKIIIKDINDLVVISRPNLVTITTTDKANTLQEEKYLLPSDNNEDIVHRKWGYYQVLSNFEGIKTKNLIIYPKQKISLQSHQYRNELMIVKSGGGIAYIDDVEIILQKDKNLYIPKNTKHQIINNNENQNLIIFEVQYGDKISEDDIARY